METKTRDEHTFFSFPLGIVMFHRNVLFGTCWLKDLLLRYLPLALYTRLNKLHHGKLEEINGRWVGTTKKCKTFLEDFRSQDTCTSSTCR